MPPEQPLLTIAIPTYNRAAYLNRLLSVLYEQIRNLHDVDLIISDNASQDGTADIVRRFQDQALRVRYLRNETNLGPDRNILQCFEAAEGRYVWICGDDDLILPGGVQLILDLIARDEYDLVYVRHYSFRGDSYLPAYPPSGMGHAVIDNVDVFVRQMHHSLSFITGNIINRVRVMSGRQHDFSSLLGTNLVQLGWTYSALNNFRRGLYIYDRKIAARDSGAALAAPIDIFGPTLKSITDKWLDRPSLKRIIINNALRTLLPLYLIRSRRSSCGISFCSVLTPVFRRNFRYWAYDYPIMRLPLFVAEGYWYLIRLSNKVERLYNRLRSRSSLPLRNFVKTPSPMATGIVKHVIDIESN